MKKFKMFISLLCCFTMLCFPCQAETSPPHFEVRVTADTVKMDDTVYLLINLKDNAGFGATQFCITYDKEKLLLENATLGELIPNGATTSINADIIGEINFSVISIQDITDSGTLLVSKFKAKDDGTTKFDFKLLTYADSNGTSLNSTSSDAEIVIESDVSSDDTESDTVVDTPETDTPNTRPSGSTSTKPSKPTDNEKEGNIEPAQSEQQKENIQISFADVTESHWAYNQIHKVAEMGVFSGTGENIFSPDLPMTRAMFVTVLHRYAGNPEAEKADFSDIEDSWYTDAVSWAAQNGIVSGTGENKFSPDAYITRGQIATILCRYKNGKSLDVNLINSFNDSGTIPDWGKESIAWAIEQGLIMGRTGGNIAFNDNATRAETAVIFTRFLNIR